MKEEKQPFIFTMDKSVADTLIKNGYTLLPDEMEDRFMFLNDSTLKFDKNDDIDILTKMCYTNILCMTE